MQKAKVGSPVASPRRKVDSLRGDGKKRTATLGHTVTKCRVVHNGGCAVHGLGHMARGTEFSWHSGKHGDTLDSFVDAGLLEVVPASDGLERLTRAELKAKAADLGLPVRAKSSKVELVAAIRSAAKA